VKLDETARTGLGKQREERKRNREREREALEITRAENISCVKKQSERHSISFSFCTVEPLRES